MVLHLIFSLIMGYSFLDRHYGMAGKTISLNLNSNSAIYSFMISGKLLIYPSFLIYTW